MGLTLFPTGGGGGGGLDPDASPTLTGTWDFISNDPYIGDHLDAIGTDYDTGDPIPNAAIRYEVDPTAAGDLFYIAHVFMDSNSAGVTTTTIEEIDYPGSGPDDLPTTTFNVILPTTGGSGDPADRTPTTAAQVITAFNTSTAAGRVTADHADGSNGSGNFYRYTSPTALRGGTISAHVEIGDGTITSPLAIRPTEKQETPLTLRPAEGSVAGTAVLNIEHYDGTPNDENGYGITHLDSDGGGAFAAERITFSQNGHLVIDGAAGQSPLTVKTDGFPIFAAGGSYAALLVGTDAPSQIALALSTTNEQTADALELYNADLSGTTFRVTPDGEVHADGGLVLKSPDGTPYRLVVADGGALTTEPA